MKPAPPRAARNPLAVVIGANSRIAIEASRHLASRGWSLLLVGRDRAALASNLSDISCSAPPGARVSALCADIDDPECETAILEASRAMGSADAVLVAAGSMPPEDECPDDRKKSLAEAVTNGHSCARLCLLFASDAAKSGTPRTVCAISSPSAARGRSATLHYGASKAYLSNFLEGLAQRFHGTGVGILDVRPGPTRTPMTRGLDGPLVSEPSRVGKRIASLIEKKASGTRYVPGFWLPVMLVIRHLPRAVFNRLRF